MAIDQCHEGKAVSQDGTMLPYHVSKTAYDTNPFLMVTKADNLLSLRTKTTKSSLRTHHKQVTSTNVNSQQECLFKSLVPVRKKEKCCMLVVGEKKTCKKGETCLHNAFM